MHTSNIRLVADSSCDLTTLPGTEFAVAPLKILTAQREYIDTPQLDVAQMAAELAGYRGRSSTACPSPGDWLAAFGQAEAVICVTITSQLSGSYNAACVARQQYLQAHPQRQVYIFDSLTAGPQIRLILEYLQTLIRAGHSFAEVCAAAESFQQRSALLFMLESMQNLANNGRVKPMAARAAGLLGIRAVGRASLQGTLELLDKCRGEKRALQTLWQHMGKLGYRGGSVAIGHCGNAAAAETLQGLILSHYPAARIAVYPLRGLCSYYAEAGGLLVGFVHQTAAPK